MISRSWMGLVISISCFAPACIGAEPARSVPPGAEVISVKRIWDQGEHNAFTDLMRANGRWLCVFREGARHASTEGAIRVLESADGEAWKSVARIVEPGVDLRDPKLSLMPDDRLMIVAGGSVMEDGKYVSRQPRVLFSEDGRSWSNPQRILAPGHWLWRVTWFRGKGYGVSYLGGGGMPGARSAFLFESTDGMNWSQITELTLPRVSETTLRFGEDGEMIAFSVVVLSTPPQPAKRGTGLGVSRPPYREWTWRELPFPSGGPNFLVMPDGRWLASTRLFSEDMRVTETALAWLSRDAVRPFATLPSGGDTSYAGLVWHEGELWMSYYSSHEGKTAIYVARIRVPGASRLAAAPAGPLNFSSP